MTAPPATDAAHNAVAAASVHWQEAVNELRDALVYGRDHGLDVDQLAEASGLPMAHVALLLWGPVT